MDKKEAFKNFIKSKPELIDYIKDSDGNIQKLYEVYDLYGEDDAVWSKYINNSRNINLHNISDLVKNIDVSSIKGHIDTAQKAIGIIEELSTKVGKDIKDIKKPLAPKPMNKFFED